MLENNLCDIGVIVKGINYSVRKVLYFVVSIISIAGYIHYFFLAYKWMLITSAWLDYVVSFLLEIAIFKPSWSIHTATFKKFQNTVCHIIKNDWVIKTLVIYGKGNVISLFRSFSTLLKYSSWKYLYKNHPHTKTFRDFFLKISPSLVKLVWSGPFKVVRFCKTSTRQGSSSSASLFSMHKS